jgi:hypothetical protein
MKPLRVGLSAASILLLSIGYAGSQAAAFAGTAREYAALIDQPQVALIGLLLLVGAVALTFVPAREVSNR